MNSYLTNFVCVVLVLMICNVDMIDSRSIRTLKNPSQQQQQAATPATPAAPAVKKGSGSGSGSGPASAAAAAVDQVRSPCPMINALANAGVLPKNGKAITKQMLIDAFDKQLGLTPQLAKGFASAAFDKFAKHFNVTAIDLSMLNLPQEKGGVEHFASLTRVDQDPAKYDPKVLDTRKPDAARILAGLQLVGKTDDSAFLTISDLAQIRRSLETGKNVPLVHRVIASAEACLLNGVLQGTADKGLSVKWYKELLIREQIPSDFVKAKPAMGFIEVGKCVVKLGVDKTGWAIYTTVIPAWDSFVDKFKSVFGW